MKKAFKYIIIIVANFALLWGLLELWLDPFELALNQSVKFNEVAIIIGFSILSLIGLFVLSRIFRKKQVQSLKRKLIYSVILIMLIFSSLYVRYSIKFINNRILNAEIRSELLEKVIIRDQRWTIFLYTPKLTNLEYKQIKRLLDLPKLNRNAFDIEIHHTGSGFLSYEFLNEVKYSLPVNIEVDELKYQGDRENYKKSQTVEQVGELQKVTFIEEWW